MKYILWVVGVVIMFAAGIVAFLMLGFPKVSEAQQMTVEITDERVERGKYLANHVTVCMDCHAQRDWTRYGSAQTRNGGSRRRCIRSQNWTSRNICGKKYNAI